MKLKQNNWNQELYQEYIIYLKSLAEDTYRNFNKKLTPTKYEMLGIRVPMQRKIAKEISRGNYQEFLLFTNNQYYEEVNIEGFIIGYIKDKEELLKYLDLFIKKIDNWAICDGFCNSLKIIAKYPEEFLEKIKCYLKSNQEFTVRVGLVLLLCYYVKKEYISMILELVNSLKKEDYYINMAASWLLAECYIKEKKQTLEFLEKNQLNKFIQNKTISKICDSYRVTKEEKEFLKKLRK